MVHSASPMERKLSAPAIQVRRRSASAMFKRVRCLGIDLLAPCIDFREYT
ncbi:MAG: hypothetical protein WDN48_04370 [Pseudolabrys sp.]